MYPDIQQAVARQEEYFEQGATLDIAYRRKALLKLKEGILSLEHEILEALREDLNKPEAEAYALELLPLMGEIQLVLKRLNSWAKPKRVRTPLISFGATSRIYAEPYGTVLIISPWNYPFSLAIWPLIGAIAAGNTAILKPSEHAPHTSRVIAKLVHSVLPPAYVTVIEGDAEVSKALLEEKFDYIFYTGGTAVGQRVMEAAAKHLTPVTLELGGKSPCIIHEDANLPLAVKRLLWGKLLNAGQTCIAPDYVYVHKRVKVKVMELIRAGIQEHYAEGMEAMTRIIHARHFQRLQTLVQDRHALVGGACDEKTLSFPLTVLDDIDWEDPVMQEELFGPILPLIEYEELGEVVSRIREQPKPLALYIFAESKSVQRLILERVSFGGGCVNDTIMQLSNPYLPFGGVGTSGMGSYHGKASFDLFSHHKSVLHQTTRYDLPIRYMKSERALRLLKAILRR